MKIKYFFPLMVFLVSMIFLSVVHMPKNITMIIQFSSFLSFFSLTYFFGVSKTIQNKEPVLKLKEKTPFVLPILFFSIPTIILTIIFIQRDLGLIIRFCVLFFVSMVIYFIGIYLLKRDLRRDYEWTVNQKKLRLERGVSAKKKLLLINPVNPNKVGLTLNISQSYPPLGLGIIAALTPPDFFIKLIDENIDIFQYEDADLVAVSSFTSNANRAYEIASIYKRKSIPVIMGGIHASMVPDEALGYVDSVVCGEGESVWQDVIRDFLRGNLKKIYRGEHLELKNMVVPKRDIFSKKYLFATVQTSRGCPMDCNFCSVTPFNGRKYRQRPYEEVLDELEKIPQKYIFFIDDNIIGYGRHSEQRAMNLFKGMIERELNKAWFCQSSLNFGSNGDLIKLAAKSGCKMVFIGLESPESDQLEEMNKNLNLKLNYEKAFKNINKHGIAVLGSFIYGSDSETKESMLKKTDYIIRKRIDVMNTTKLTPLPGTGLFREFHDNDRLNYTHFPGDWDRYDMTEVTYKLKKMDEEEFSGIYDQCSKKLFSKWTLYKKFVKTMIHTKSLETAMWAYNANIGYRNIALKNIKACSTSHQDDHIKIIERNEKS